MSPGPSLAPTHASRAELFEIVDSLSAELDAVARRLSDAIHDQLDELDEDLRSWTVQSVRANLGIIVTMLREGTAPAAAVAPAEALIYAKEYVRRGLRLEVLLRAYRTGQRELSRIALDRLRSSGAQAAPDAGDRIDAVGFFSDWLFAWVETLERQVADVYMNEREQWVRGAVAMRAAEVRALLDGARDDLAATSRRLAYDLDRHHIAFVVWSDDTHGDDAEAQSRFGAMEARAGAIAEALGAHGWLTVPQGRLLAGLHEPGDPAAAHGIRDASGLRVALGSSGHGVEGFCVSHREALRARHVAGLGRGRGAVTAYDDVALDVLATQDQESARRFVERELGPLAADDDNILRLRATLRVFLEEGASFVGAARRLGLHENTVTYRVHRAEQLLGHRAADRQLELGVALRLARLVLPVTPAEG
jgi:hypothetical protein